MKPALVSLILPLVFLSPPNQGLPTIVVMGRVTNAATSAGLEAANVRMPEVAASVGTDSNGRYRIVILDKFRGLEVTVNVRAIGFAPQTRTIRLVSDTITIDFALAVDVNRLMFGFQIVLIAFFLAWRSIARARSAAALKA